MKATSEEQFPLIPLPIKEAISVSDAMQDGVYQIEESFPLIPLPIKEAMADPGSDAPKAVAVQFPLIPLPIKEAIV